MNTRKLIGSLTAALFVSANASAGDSNFYLGVGVGDARQHNSYFDGSDTSFKLLAGYSFNRYFAAEAGLIDAGTQKDEVGSLAVKSSSEGAFAAVLAKLPIGNVVAPYAKLGYVLYDTRDTVSTGGVHIRDDRSGDDFLFGGGIEFRIGENLRLRAEYEKVDVPYSDFDITSVAFTYEF